MPSSRTGFPGSQGVPLAARIETPSHEPHAWAIFAHCFTCSKDSKAATRIARRLAEAGFGVLRFDFTGLGGSGGDFENTHFSSNVEDLVAAADWLRARRGVPSLLVGHSLGGAAVLAAAHRIADARAVATLGAPFEPGHVTHLFGEDLQTIAEQGQATVTLAGRPFRIRRTFLDDLSGQDQEERIRTLGRALLVMHSPQDRVVPVENAASIFKAARHPKSFVALDGADHMLDRDEDARFVADVVAAWATRYVPRPAPTGVGAPGEWVEVEETGRGNFEVSVTAGAHRWLCDEPASVGGGDAGPTPYDLLSASLGACTAMTLRLYARQKGMALDRVRVRLRHEKIHAADCERCETSTGRIDRIEREIAITGTLDQTQRDRLLEIADRCPVHRTLHGEVDVVTRMAGQVAGEAS